MNYFIYYWDGYYYNEEFKKFVYDNKTFDSFVTIKRIIRNVKKVQKITLVKKFSNDK